MCSSSYIHLGSEFYKLMLFDTGKARWCPDFNLLWQYAFKNVEIYLFWRFAEYVCDYIEINAVHFWHFQQIPSCFDLILTLLYFD